MGTPSLLGALPCRVFDFFFLRFPFLLFFISILYIIPRPKLEIESHKILHPLHLLGKKVLSGTVEQASSRPHEAILSILDRDTAVEYLHGSPYR